MGVSGQNENINNNLKKYTGRRTFDNVSGYC